MSDPPPRSSNPPRTHAGVPDPAGPPATISVRSYPAEGPPSTRHRRVPCGPASFLTEGMRVSVRIIPSFTIRDPDLGVVKVRGALVARRLGTIHVYANLCRHIPLTLDLGDGEVASQDGRYFLCHHHGALYRVDNGACASGPCDGESLLKLDFVVEPDGALVLLIPEP